MGSLKKRKFATARRAPTTAPAHLSAAYQAGKRLMLGTRVAFPQKIPEFDRGHLAAGRNIGFVQNNDPAIVGTAQ